jgi:hypothetical protein
MCLGERISFSGWVESGRQHNTAQHLISENSLVCHLATLLVHLIKLHIYCSPSTEYGLWEKRTYKNKRIYIWHGKWEKQTNYTFTFDIYIGWFHNLNYEDDNHSDNDKKINYLFFGNNFPHVSLRSSHDGINSFSNTSTTTMRSTSLSVEWEKSDMHEILL